MTNQGNLLVSETGTTTLHSGRISIVDQNGNRRTLLEGLPSAINVPVEIVSGDGHTTAADISGCKGPPFDQIARWIDRLRALTGP